VILPLHQALKVSDHYPVEVELKSCFETPTTPPVREGKGDI